MESEDELETIENLLSALDENTNLGESKTTKEIDFLSTNTNVEQPSTSKTSETLLKTLYTGDTDSSDDEDRRNHESRYNDFGKNIKNLLKKTETSVSIKENGENRTLDSKTTKTWKKPTIIPELNPPQQKIVPTSSTLTASTVSTDPIFSLRVIKPLISSTSLVEKMNGRKTISFNNIRLYLEKETHQQEDWVIGGVMVMKGETRLSSKGVQYSIWTLSDLRDELKTVNLFLFRSAFKYLWKTNKGAVLAVLNPGVLANRSTKDEASLFVDDPERVLFLGQSKDLGYCKSKKKSGDVCNAFINASKCEYCIYHVKQEYNKFSNRSEFQHNSGNRGINALKNKVLGKNEVFYAGKSFTAIPKTQKNFKQMRRDEDTLRALSGENRTLSAISQKSAFLKQTVAAKSQLDASNKQRIKDLERLRMLRGETSSTVKLTETSESSKVTGNDDISVENARQKAKMLLMSKRCNKEDENTLKLNDCSLNKNEMNKLPNSQSILLNNIKDNPLKTASTNNSEDLNSSTQNIAANSLSKDCPSIGNQFLEPNILSKVPKINENTFKEFVVEFGEELNNKKKIDNQKSMDTVTKNNSTCTKVEIKPEKLQNSSKNVQNKLKVFEKVDKVEPKKPLMNKNLKLILEMRQKEKEQKLAKSQEDLKSSVDKLNNPKKTDVVISSVSSSSPLDLIEKFGQNSKKSTQTENNTVGSIKIQQQIKTPKISENFSVQSVITNAEGSKVLKNNDTISSRQTPEITINTPENKSNDSNGNIAQKLTSTRSLVDLSVPFSKKKVLQARLNALEYVKTHGPIRNDESRKRRCLDVIDKFDEAKKQKLEEDAEAKKAKYKEIMEKGSLNTHLVENYENQKQEEYFDKLEMKEKLENKMINTFKIACKIVKCHKCKYSSFSAAEICKTERHKLSIVDGFKRFFKCSDCTNRTVALEIIPLHTCKKCGGSRWERTSMMKDKALGVHKDLSIRGDEEKYAGGFVKDASINLLVPDEGC